MRIVKPYGRSHVVTGERTLHLNKQAKTFAKIPEFAQSHDELVIAQWISIIDKIATKPKGEEKGNQDQCDLRRKIGDAAWELLVQEKLLQGLNDSTKKEYLVKLWGSKVEPYKNNTGKKVSEKKAKGRWYKRFMGTAPINQIHGLGLARKIYDHLYTKELCFNPNGGVKDQGLIQARAESIEKNILHQSPPVCVEWSDADLSDYFKSDVAKKIYDVAVAKKKKADEKAKMHKKPPKVFKVPLSLAAAELHSHYALVFQDANGNPKPIKDVKETPLFKLHTAVKDCYRRILKQTQSKNILPKLPKDKHTLCNLLKQKQGNKDLASLIRVGKIIHYENETTNENWPNFEPVAISRFWGSDGQAEIKRNEAFVRVWRHSLSLASRTLKDWADPDNQLKEDILGKSQIQQVLGKKIFKTEHYEKKIPVIFGIRAEDFIEKGNIEFHKEILKFGLATIFDLRNASFHFKKRIDFIDTLNLVGTREKKKNEDVIEEMPESVLEAINKLWCADYDARIEQLHATMEAAHCAEYLSFDQNTKLFETISNSETGELPLPRLNRVLLRAENASAPDIRLPKPAKRDKLEADPALVCQYTLFQLLYARPFRCWLEKTTGTKVKGYIDKALQRTKKAAKKINGNLDEDLIEAKAAKILPDFIVDKDTIETFFFSLTGATATEMRVQKGYESDSKQAKTQAEAIEELKCDVIARAFSEYLETKGFNFLLHLKKQDGKLPDKPETAISSPENWQTKLYFLLHLIPVDDVSKLLHQIRKWNILSKKDKDEKDIQLVTKLHETLTLYLDMHDAKFQGDQKFSGAEAFKELFEHENDFKAIYTTENEQLIPRRGLREIMRFGHFPLLKKLTEGQKVTKSDVEKWKSSQDKISVHQKKREDLHATWVKQKKKISEKDRQAYKMALKAVSDHRHLSAQVTLTNHIRLHRLLMNVLGRLVDFSGLFERDMYFVFLGLWYYAQPPIEHALKEDGLSLFKDGQIIKACRNIECLTLKNQMDTYFPNWDSEGESKSEGLDKMRNYFAHFKMLEGTDPSVDLSQCINTARQLMTYDRKLKNAVSQSVIEMLGREGLELKWEMDNHYLTKPSVMSKMIYHLGSQNITETHHSKTYTDMVASLFEEKKKE